MARSLIFQVPNGPQGRGYIIQALLLIVDHLPRRFAQCKLVAHFLEPRSESFNLFLLPGYSRFLLLELPGSNTPLAGLISSLAYHGRAISFGTFLNHEWTRMNTNLQISASLLVNGFIRVDSC